MEEALMQKILESLKEDFEICGDYLKQIASEVINNEVSKYPIFVAHTGELEIGVPVIKRTELDTNFNFNASHLEDFVNKDIVRFDKVRDFQKTYKPPLEYACILVVLDDFANYVYIPYDE